MNNFDFNSGFSYFNHSDDQEDTDLNENIYEDISFENNLIDISQFYQFGENNETTIPTFDMQPFNEIQHLNATEFNKIGQLTEGDEGNNSFINKESTSGGSTRTSKRKVGLSKKAELFKNAFYHVFTEKKRFPKNLVKKIHDYIIKFLPIPKMKRDQIRSIDLYFSEYSIYSEIILSFLQNHREMILGSIPELKDI